MAQVQETDPQEGPSGQQRLRLKVCQVCYEDTSSYNLNYGISTCLGCRAFFRRSVQGEQHLNYICRNIVRCEITLKTRKRCQKCRYAKCLEVGMQRQCVLDEEQKKQRFRKLMEKQRKMAASDPQIRAVIEADRLFFHLKRQIKSGGGAAAESSESDKVLAKTSNVSNGKEKCRVADTHVKKRIGEDVNTVEIDNGSTSPDSSSNEESDAFGRSNCKYPTSCLHEPVRQTHSTRKQADHANLRVRKLMMKNLEYVRFTWATAFKPIGDSSCQFTRDLVCSHLGDFTLTKSGLKSHLMSIATAFKNFALHQPEFTALPFADQQRLLCRNVPTFVQFVISMYLSAEDPAEQICWMLLGGNKLDINPEKLHFMSLFTLKERLSWFTGNCSNYLDQLDKLILLRSAIPIEEAPFFALNCLFSASRSTALDNAEMAREQRSTFRTLVEWKQEVYGGVSPEKLQETFSVVEKLMQTFEDMVDWDESDGYLDSSSFHSLVLCTMDSIESHWLQSLRANFNEAFSSVSFGTDFLEIILLASRDPPCPELYMRRTNAMFTDRLRQILNTQDVFSNLSGKRQAALMASEGVNDAMTLQASKVKMCKSGVEQFRAMFGYENDALIAENSELCELFRGGPIQLTGVDTIRKGLYDEATLVTLVSLTEIVLDELSNVNYYMLFLLSLLFREDHVPALHHRVVRHLVYLRSVENHFDGWKWYSDLMGKWKELMFLIKKLFFAVREKS